MKKIREYLRCPECLGVWSVDLELPEGPTFSRRQAFREALQPALEGGCPWCEAADVVPEDMGEVRTDSDRLEITEVVPKCDGRCTHAVGPLCVCRCGCANHGLGFLAYVERRTDNGKLRTRFKAAPKNMEAARARAIEWQAVRADLLALDGTLKAEVERWTAKQRGTWLSAADYKAKMDVYNRRRRIAEVIALRVHKRRMAEAAKLLGQTVPAVPEPAPAPSKPSTEVQEVLAKAEEFVAEKKAAGWTQPDFAKALGDLFDGKEES